MPSTMPNIPSGPGSQSSNGSSSSSSGKRRLGTSRRSRAQGTESRGPGSERTPSGRSSRAHNRSSGSNNGSINNNNNIYNNNNNTNNGSNNKNNTVSTVAKSKTLDETAKYYINYGVLALHDPKLGQIFLATTVCNVYVYDYDTEGWNKSFCQGPLFLYSRVVPESSSLEAGDNGGGDGALGSTNSEQYEDDPGTYAPYALLVLNRLSLDNFSLAVTPKSVAAKRGVETVSMYRDGDFLIVQSPDDTTYGIYLYKEAERANLLSTVEWCLNVDL